MMHLQTGEGEKYLPYGDAQGAANSGTAAVSAAVNGLLRARAKGFSAD